MINCKISEGFQASGTHIIFVGQEDFEKTLETYLGKNLPPVFEASYAEVQIMQKKNALFFLAGIGNKTDVSAIFQAALKFSYKYGKQLKNTTVNYHLPDNFNTQQSLAAYKGFFLGAYNLKNKTEHILYNSEATLNTTAAHHQLAKEALILANAQITSMNWLNKPANKKSGPVIADFVKQLAEKYNLECTVYNREKATREKLEAYLAVNRASEHDAAFIILKYKHPQPKKTIGLVGKCVTFDTGGISIKPSQNLHYMKSDMGGATAVLGTFQAIAEMQLPVNAIGIIPATDNAVSEKAYLPSDVINSHSGKTIEVIDTDAEGRLTLADGLSYVIKNYNPEIVIDLATLTGSAVRTFGYECAALFSNNNTMIEQLKKAGEASGEKVWPLPMWENYEKNLQSDIADIKNYSGKPITGAIDAAIFLKNFTHGHEAWAHLDIAGVAFGNTPFGKDKTATGYGVQLLITYLKTITT